MNRFISLTLRLAIQLGVAGIAFFVFWIADSGAVVVTADEYPDVQIVRADAQGMLLRYRPPQLMAEMVNTSEGLFSRFSIDQTTRISVPGQPELPVRVIILGVPLAGEVNAWITAGDFEFQENVSVVPTPTITGKDEKDQGLKVEYHRGALYNANRVWPPVQIMLEGPFFIRNQRVLRLKLFPVLYNPVQKRVQFFKQIEVQVAFNPGSRPIGEQLPVMAGVLDIFEPIYASLLLNYEQARAWRWVKPQVPLAKALQPDPFLNSAEWYKITIRNNGIYKIDYNALANAGLNMNLVNPDSIRIFSAGGRPLPVFNEFPRPEMREQAIKVTGANDGRFDRNDAIYFYGWSVDSWDTDSTGQPVFIRHPYTRENVYWLTVGGSFATPPRRMGVRDGTPSSSNAVLATTFTDRIHLEEDRLLAEDFGEIFDYYNWYWMNGQTLPAIFANLPGATGQDSAIVSVTFHGFGLRLNQLLVNQVSAETLPGQQQISKSVLVSRALVKGLNQFNLFFQPGSAGYYFDALEVSYPRDYSVVGEQLFFGAPAVSGTVEYRLTGINSTSALVWEVTDPFAVEEITGAVLTSGTLRFQDSIASGLTKQYLLVGDQLIQRPLSISQKKPQRLRAVSNRADFLIITHDNFYDQMVAYGQYRQAKSGLNPMVVKVSDIYDQFAWGLFDPVAIRDFLKQAWQVWEQPPAYVLLVGDGTYDYRNNLGTGSRSFVPPFIGPPGFDPTTVSDENYLYFGRPGLLDPEPFDQQLAMVIGRWPVQSSDQVEAVIAKIKAYEATPDFGIWRNLVTIVADDEFGDRKAGRLDERYHTQQAEDLSRRVPPAFDLQKIYLMEFPVDANLIKPQAREAIVNAFNRGTLIIDYIGHGNPDVWAHEKVFRRTEDIPRLNNYTRQPLVYTASCSIGYFDSPFSQGMGEELLRYPGGGAIAIIAATRLVFSSANVELNKKVFDLLLGQDQLSLAEALFTAKLLRQYQGCLPIPCPNLNDRQYIYFGDPAMHLAAPRYRLLYQTPLPDSLVALAVTNLTGEVVDTSGVRLNLNGAGEVQVFDAHRLRTHIIEVNPGNPVTYVLPGNRIFRGLMNVNAGQFNLSFVVPKDISYGRQTARISTYAFNTYTDGVGALDSLRLVGSSSAIADSSGPEITLQFDDRPGFTDGDYVRADARLAIRLYDENGINITGEPGHGITVKIDQSPLLIFDVTNSFVYDEGSYQTGSATLQLPLLSAGSHLLEVKAWDSANNSALKSVRIQIEKTGRLAILDFLAYPNPSQEQTTFCYQLTQDVLDFKIQIFTESGRLIRTLFGNSQQAGFHAEIVWDGKDQDGDWVANGVYLCKAVARGSSGERATGLTEAYGKVLVVR